MISYDNYKNRIEKLAKVKRRLHKFRFLICGALVLVIGATVGLMCAKGAYTSDMSLSAQSVYFNEPYEVTPAKAFLCTASEQYIEYRAEGGGWTSAKPVKAGRYEARTASKKIGGYSYSPSVEFEILPLEAEFTVTGASVTYGDAPSFTVPQLVSGHRVDKSALEFTYASYGAPATEVNVQKDSIKIVDASGDDFSDCYDFVKVTGKTLNINKRNITVTPASYEFTYDGIAHAPDGSVTEETQKRLVTGDTLTVTTSVSGFDGTLAGGAVNAGGYTVELNGISLTHGGADISAWYNVTRGSSSMQINRRPLTVTTGSAEKVYDGTPAENTRFTADNLVAGHSAAIRKSTLPKNADVGSYENVFGIAISDGVSDVTDNYALTFDAGTLKINPAALTVATATPEAHTYDGKPFTDFSFSVKETLSESFTVSAVERLGGDTTDAGSYDNAFAVAVTLNGEDVTRNFKIDYTYGKLVVNKRKMTITTGSDTKVYDGQPFVCDNPVAVGLVPEHRCGIVSGFSVTNVTGAGGVKNDLKYTVYNEYGREVGNKNYEIEHVSGTLIIEPLRIEIHTATDSREYDGTPFINTNYTVVRLNAYGEGLCGADVLTPVHVTSITDVANVVNGCTYTLPTYDGVHSNYELDSYVFGTLKIEPKKVTVNINPVAADYGEKIPDNGFTLDCTALPNGETLTFTMHIEKAGVIVTPETWEGYTLLDAGDYEITPTEGTQKITGGNASLKNYDFTYVNGALEIGARGIIVTTATASHIYDGNEFSDTSYSTVYADGEGKGLLKGDALTVNSYMAVRTIDDIPTPNVVKYAVPNGNYEIVETIYGTLTITPRPIIVYTGSAEKTYDGNPLYNEEYSVKYAVWDESAEEWTADEEKVGLIAGDTLALKGNHVSITDKDEKENANEYENGNYDIKKYVNGTLKIDKKQVKIKLTDMTADYGDEAKYTAYRTQANGGIVYTDGEAVSGETLVVTVGFEKDGAVLEATNGQYKLGVGSYTVYLKSFDIENGNKNNYGVSCGDGNLIVGKLTVTVDIGDGTAVYGENVSEKTYSVDIDPETLPYNETFSVLSFKYDREVKNVGEYEIQPDRVALAGQSLENYTLNFNYGTLKVTAKRLTIQLQPATAVYGKPITDPESKVGNLAYDDKITEMTFGYTLNGQPVEKLKNAGTYGTTLSALEINGIAVALASENENYYVEVVDSTLTITPAPLTITFTGSAVEYGTDLSDYKPAYTFDLDGKMPYNESFEIGAFTYWTDEENEAPERKEVGDYLIKGGNLAFKDESGNAIDGGEDNYAVAYAGALTVNKKQVNIKLLDKSYKYGREDLLNGSTFHEYERTDGSDEPALAYGEQMIVWVSYKENGKIVGQQQLEHLENVSQWRFQVGGNYTRYATRYSIYSREDVSTRIDSGTAEELKNYEITCGEGNVTITPYTVTVKPNDNSCVYGTPESEIENTFKYVDKWTIERGGLPYGEELELSYSYDPSPVKNVGDYAIKAAATGVKYGDLKNYTVSYEEGTLNVTLKQIYIKFDNKQCVYGDDLPEVTYKLLDKDNNELSLPHGDKYELGKIMYRKAGEYESITPKNVDKYLIDLFDNGKVINGDVDVSGNYHLMRLYGNLTITPKTVTVVLNDISPVIYGDTFSYPTGVNNFANYETIELEYNEKLEVAVKYKQNGTDITPKNAGLYSAEINSENCIVYNADGSVNADGAANYTFNCTPLENLKINTKTIRIEMDDMSVLYGEFCKVKPDGSYEVILPETHTFKFDELFGNPEYGDEFTVKTIKFSNVRSDEKITPKECGKYWLQADSVSVTYWDNSAETLTRNEENNWCFFSNYSVFFNFGTLTISPRPVTVTIDDQTAIYGEELPENSFTVTDGAMQYDEALSLTYKYDREVKDVGEYDITENKIFIDGKEIDRENCNYAFTFIAGTLTVGQKTINVEIAKDYTAIYGEALPTLTANAEGLVPGDTFEATTFRYYTAEDKLADITPRNAGEYGITVKTAKINGIETPLESEEGNYYITVTDGLLTIGQAELKLVLSQLKTVAYGNPYGYPAGKGNFDKTKTTGLITGDELELAVKYTYRGCDSTLVKPDFESTAPPVNAALYYVKLVKEKSYLHTAYGEKLALGLNYKVSCKDGQFTINPRNVDVYYSFSDYVYGQTVAKPEFTIKVFKNANDPADFSTINLPYGETCDFDLEYYDGKNPSVTQPKNAGKYKVGVINVYVNGETEFACNYIFTVNDGKDYADLTITPKPIEIMLDDMTATYGDFEFAKPETHTFTPTEGVLEYTDKLTVKIDFTAVGDEATANYITPENVGLYSIVAKEFAVTYFDGATETAAGDKLKNYVITCNHGTLTIKPKPLNLVISDIDGIFYGDTITPNSYKVYDGETEYTFADGETLSVNLAYYKGDNTDIKPKNADTYGVTVKSLTFNGTAVAPTEEGYAAGNYIIKVTNGTLTITPRPVIVYTGSAEKPYDGTPLTNADYDAVKYAVQNETTGEWTADESKAGLIAGDTLALKGDAVYRTAAGETANANKYENANYDIKTYVNGTLTVTQRGIEIKLNKGGVTSFIYGTLYAGAIRNAEISGAVSGEEIEVAVVYSVRGGAQTTPKDVGGYTATLNFNDCTVTDKNGEVEGGINNYYLSAECAPVDFEITKMTLTVSVENAERIYGEPVPAALAYSVAETMPAGESLTLAFSFAQEDGSLPVHVKEGGYPVTVAGAEIEGGKISNYALKYTNANPTLTINAKPVSIRLSDIGATYGKPVVYTVKPDNYDKDNSDPLIEGDKLTVTEVKYIQGNTEFTSDNAPVNAGTYGIALVSCKIVNADGENVTGDYDVEGLNGRLLIDSALVTVYTGSVDEIYDGNAHFTKEATYDGDITGYRLVADEENISKQIDATDENGVDNKTKFKIVDGSGKATDNFTIIYGPDNKTYGKLIVRPKPVGVTIDNATAVYGVQPALTFGTVGLVGEESLSFAVEYDGGAVSPTVGGGYFVMPVGTYSMTYLEKSAAISGGRAKASNYAFTFNENAQFTVTPRHINVTTANARKVYDGTPLTKTDGYTTKWVLDGAEQNKAGLINGETLTVEFTASLTDVGDCPNACTYTANGNYVIDKVNAGKLTVTRLSVTAKTADVVETYDGKPHSSGVVTDVDRKLVEGHRFVVTSDPIEQIDVTAGVSNVLTVKIMCGDEDVTDNYTVIYRYGKITINKRPVTITTGGVSGVIYDGQPHGSEEYKVSDGLLTELKHGLKINKTFAYVNATDEKGVENAVIFDIYCGDKNVTGNYEITYAYGRIIIGKRPVNVALNGGVEVEYGEDYAAALTRGALTLVAGDTYKLAISADADGIGEFTAAVDWENSKFLNADGKNVKDNYAFTCVPETVQFTILPRNITVTLNAGGRTVFVYGEDYDTAMRNARIDRAVAGDTFEVTVSYGGETPKYVGDNYTAELVGIGNENYNVIKCDPVGFKIVAKDLYFYMDDLTVGYGDAPVYPDGVKGFRCIGLVGGDSVEVAPAFEKDGERVTPEYAGSYDIVCGGITVNGGAVSADNYNIVTNKKGTLTINGESLLIERLPLEKYYDGAPLEATDDAIKYYLNGVEGAPLIDGCSIVLDGEFATKDGNVSSSCLNAAKYKVEGENAGNYEISYVDNGARLEIKPLAFEVEVADMTQIYGETFNTGKYYTAALINGETLSYRVKLVDAGVTLNAGTYGITGNESGITFVSGGKAENYDISFKEGKLTVTQRRIMVRTATAEREYDGTAFAKPEGYATFLVIDGKKQAVAGLVNGDKLTPETWATQTEVGSCQNVCAYTVSDNYFIEEEMYEYGTLTVTKKSITVTTGGIDGTYRGTPYSNGDFSYDITLPENYAIERIGDPAEFLAATRNGKNEFAVRIKNAAGDDVSESYDIHYVYGKVVIARATLTVKLNDAQTRFDYGDNSFDGKFKQGVTVTGLVGGDTLTTVALSYNTADGNAPVNAGDYTASLDLTNSFISYAGEGNGIGNYVIDCAEINFTVARLKITLSLDKWAAIEYDGNSHAYDGGYSITDGALAEGETLANVAVKYCADAAGERKVGVPKNAGTYYVFPDLDATMVRRTDYQSAISKNYEVTCGYVTFTIDRKALVITLDDAVHTYDGKAYDYKKSGGVHTNLCAGDSIDYDAVYSDTPVNFKEGGYTVTLENISYSDNYTLDEANSRLTCKLTIEKRDITVKVADRNVERGDEEYSKADITASAVGGGEGFVNGDLDNATVTFSYADKLPLPENAVALKTVTVSLGGGVMNNYNVVGTTAGTLTVTERKVLVTPVFKGNTPYVYGGNAVDLNLFGYTHVHNVANAAADDYGFTAEDAASFTATYAFTDENGNEVAGAPVNAGSYTVKLTLSGAGLGGYYIEYEEITFEIAKRSLTYTVEVDGAGEYVYSGERPAFSATLADGYDGFINGNTCPAYTVELFKGGEPATRYNVGTYTVMISFAGMENYEINATSAKIKIVERTLVIIPKDPYGGAPQTYKGSNLKLGPEDYTVKSKALVAACDELTVTSNEIAPTSQGGSLKISGVSITDKETGENVAGNYVVYYTYDPGIGAIKELGLKLANFSVKVSYEVQEIHYKLGAVGKSVPYTGKEVTYPLDAAAAITLADGYALYKDHIMSFTKSEATVPAAAGVYPDIVKDMVCVRDRNGNVLSVYNLVCDYSAEAVITVVENVVSVDLSGLSADTLTSGTLSRAVTFADEDNACNAEVTVYDLDGKWLIGITLFSDAGADLSANYKLDENCKLDGAEVRIITLAEAKKFKLPALGVEIKVTAAQLESGRGTLYAFDNESRWVLQESCYTVTGTLLEGHKLQVLVFRENGNYLLGVTVYSETDGKRSEESAKYRLRDIVATGVSARYVEISEAASLPRELCIDFGGAFNADGTPKVENGFVTGYTVEGLNVTDNHVLEITAEKSETGYILTAVIYQNRRQGKFDVGDRYELVYTAPAGVQAVKGTVN